MNFPIRPLVAVVVALSLAACKSDQVREQPQPEPHATYLSAHPGAQVTLEGHADERGTREYNLGLGERRGNSVRDALLAQGANARQIDVVSYGEERPVCRESDESCWWQNRRVEILYTATGE